MPPCFKATGEPLVQCAVTRELLDKGAMIAVRNGGNIIHVQGIILPVNTSQVNNSMLYYISV